MVLGAINDGPYKLTLILHIVAVIVAMAPAVVHPILFETTHRAGGDIQALAQRIVGLPSKIYSWALIVAGILGIGLIGQSDSVIEWGDTWIWLSLVLWVAAIGAEHGGIFPAERALAGGDLGAYTRLKQFGGLATVLLLVVIVLMISKPGA